MANYETFSLLNESSTSANSVYGKYKDITTKFVVYNEQQYYVFANFREFQKYSQTIPQSERTFHEVISARAQKIKFDIDAPIESIARIQENTQKYYNNVIKSIISAIQNMFHIVFNIELDSKDIVICNSHGSTKYSTHIIVNKYYVNNNVQAKIFFDKVIECIPALIHYLIDASVYKKNQNFRIAGSVKRNSDRIKVIESGHLFEDSLITNTEGCILLPNLADNVESTRQVILSEDIDKVLALCKEQGLMEDFSFRDVRENVLSFNRIRASHCDLCKRIHDSDNTQYVRINQLDGAIEARIYCRHNTSNGFTVLGEVESLASIKKPEDKIKAARDNIERIIKNKDTIIHANLPTMFDTIDVYSEPLLRAYTTAPTLVVHAPMKMGKTKALIEYLDTYKPERVVFVSCRQTLCNELKSKFQEYDLYSDCVGTITINKIIIQVESLHRLAVLSGSNPPDLLILDEVESIFEQFNSGLSRTSDDFNKFQYLVKHSKQVICLDANISNRTLSIIKKLRPQHSIHMQQNKYKNATDYNYRFMVEYNDWLIELGNMLRLGNKIVIPTSSLKEANAIHEYIKVDFSHLKCMLYSSETSITIKRDHFQNVNDVWSQYDVVIYTPTISAGISFERAHFNKVFAYFDSMSCPVETCIQMLGRVRNLLDKEICIVCNVTYQNLQTETARIEDEVIRSRISLVQYKHTIPFALAIDINYGENGTAEIKKHDYFHVWLENTRMINLSRCFFIRRLLHYILETGAQVTLAEIQDKSHCIRSRIDTIKDQLKLEFYQNIVDARDLTQDEVTTILYAFKEQTEVVKEDNVAYERYKLKRDYDRDENFAPDIDFIDLYYASSMRGKYKRAKLITQHSNVDLTLAQIITKEQITHAVCLNQNNIYRDINYRYESMKHNAVITVVKLIGFQNINDTNSVLVEDAQIIMAGDTFKNAVLDIIKLFNYKTRLLTSKNYITYINKSLNDMYYATIKKEKIFYRIIIDDSIDSLLTS